MPILSLAPSIDNRLDWNRPVKYEGQIEPIEVCFIEGLVALTISPQCICSQSIIIYFKNARNFSHVLHENEQTHHIIHVCSRKLYVTTLIQICN